MRKRMARGSEYHPAGSDPYRFVLYHHGLFTGYVIAAVCGASKWSTPLRVFADWCRPFHVALEEAIQRFKEPMPAPIEAGHHWEPAICSTAASLIFGDAYLSGRVQIRDAGPIVDGEYGWILATPDALVLPGDSIAIESKFKCFKLPARPDTEHLFQLHLQMRVLRAPYIYIAYGHRPGATDLARFRDGQDLQVRVFLVHWSEPLWRWMWGRIRTFKRSLDARTVPAIQDVAERLNRAWDTDDGYADLPPRPTYECLGTVYHDERMPPRISLHVRLGDKLG